VSAAGAGQAAELVTRAEAFAGAAAAGFVVISCGAAKLGHAAAAAELYTGQYFRACHMTAAELAPDRWLILSAKYGLLWPWQQIAPYDLTIGEPGAITAREVTIQAARLGMLGQHVTALCSARYADVLGEVFPNVWRPLAGLGIGRQRAMLAELRRAVA
jgi:hypothetical protein